MKSQNLQNARNLYFNTTLSQAQIAEVIGVSQKTISIYISENNWKLLKQKAQQLPPVFIDQMNSELQELNARIAARPEGKRIPTSEEAELRRKILYSLAALKDHQSVSNHIEGYTNLAQYIAGRNIRHARLLCGYSVEYLQEKLKIPGDKNPTEETLALFPELNDEDLDIDSDINSAQNSDQDIEEGINDTDIDEEIIYTGNDNAEDDEEPNETLEIEETDDSIYIQ